MARTSTALARLVRVFVPPRPAQGIVVALLALAAVGLACRQPPPEVADATGDLVALLDLATVLQETGLVDLGTPHGRALLEHGWSWDEAAETTFAWGVGQRSTLRFFVTTPRDLPIALRGSADQGPSGEAQTVGVAVNGEAIAELEIGRFFDEYRASLPAAALVPGWNRLELTYGHWRPGPKIRQLAVKWDWIRFAEGEAAGEAARADAAGEAIYLAHGAQLEYYVRLAQGAWLDVAELSSAGDDGARLTVFVEPEGGEAAEVAALEPGRDLRVDLETAGPGVARLLLRAVGAGSGGLTLKRPRVGPVPAGDALPAPAPRVNVIVYLIDALRADRLGAYGQTAPLTPSIDAFAARALVFEDTIAQSSWTKPTVASLFTGMQPPAHGVLLREHALPQRAVTLAEILRAAGYRTAGFSTNPFVSRSFGLDQGFLEFTYLDSGRDGVRHAFSDEVNERVFEWLDDPPERPFLLYVHTIDPHAPYTPPRPDGTLGGGESPAAVPSCREQRPLSDEARRRLIERYDDEVTFNDASFGRFIQELRRRRLYDDSLVILLSDHGEAFWEHQGWRHENYLYSEVLDIPLIVKPPRGTSSSAAEGLAQQVDVLPTILDVLRLPVPAAVQGRSLLAADGDAPPRVGFADMECASGKRITAVLAGPWKLIRTLDPDGTVQRLELYHRLRDPGERADESAAEPVVVQRLLALLEAHAVQRPLEPARAEIGDELKETLRALGYVD